MSHFWAFRREIAQNNECIRLDERDNITPNNNPSPNSHFTTPQTMLHRRPQNHSMSLNNITQGIYIYINLILNVLFK